MLSLVTIIFSSFVIALSGAMMPGPLLTAVVSETPRRGFVAGPVMIIGHGILELALVTALLLGLAPFLEKAEVFAAIAITGGVILIWMALGMFRSIPGLSLSWEVDKENSGHLIISGILMSIANPYWMIWWATIGLGYILHCKQFGIWGMLMFFIGHILGDLIWYTVVSAAISRGRKFLSDKIYRGMIGICAVFLIFFACYFIYSGLDKIIS